MRYILSRNINAEKNKEFFIFDRRNQTYSSYLSLEQIVNKQLVIEMNSYKKSQFFNNHEIFNYRTIIESDSMAFATLHPEYFL